MNVLGNLRMTGIYQHAQMIMKQLPNTIVTGVNFYTHNQAL